MWMDKGARARHYLFMRGFPEAARNMWHASAAFKQFKPKRIVPVPPPPAAVLADDAPRQFDLCTVLRRPHQVPTREALADIGTSLEH